MKTTRTWSTQETASLKALTDILPWNANMKDIEELYLAFANGETKTRRTSRTRGAVYAAINTMNRHNMCSDGIRDAFSVWYNKLLAADGSAAQTVMNYAVTENAATAQVAQATQAAQVGERKHGAHPTGDPYISAIRLAKLCNKDVSSIYHDSADGTIRRRRPIKGVDTEPGKRRLYSQPDALERFRVTLPDLSAPPKPEVVTAAVAAPAPPPIVAPPSPPLPIASVPIASTSTQAAPRMVAKSVGRKQASQRPQDEVVTNGGGAKVASTELANGGGVKAAPAESVTPKQMAAALIMLRGAGKITEAAAFDVLTEMLSK